MQHMCITSRGFADNGLVKIFKLSRIELVIDIRSDLSKSTGNVIAHWSTTVETSKFIAEKVKFLIWRNFWQYWIEILEKNLNFKSFSILRKSNTEFEFFIQFSISNHYFEQNFKIFNSNKIKIPSKSTNLFVKVNTWNPAIWNVIHLI